MEEERASETICLERYEKAYSLLVGDKIKYAPKEDLNPYSVIYDGLWWCYYAKLFKEITICIAHPNLNEEEEDLLQTLREFLIKKSKEIR